MWVGGFGRWKHQSYCPFKPPSQTWITLPPLSLSTPLSSYYPTGLGFTRNLLLHKLQTSCLAVRTVCYLVFNTGMYWQNSSGPESDTLWKYAGWFVQNVHTAETQQNILSVQLSRQKKSKSSSFSTAWWCHGTYEIIDITTKNTSVRVCTHEWVHYSC